MKNSSFDKIRFGLPELYGPEDRRRQPGRICSPGSGCGPGPDRSALDFDKWVKDANDNPPESDERSGQAERSAERGAHSLESDPEDVKAPGRPRRAAADRSGSGASDTECHRIYE